jgi:succinate-semialdehyde dehydrogenase/glutarate-semialdehyde dehydrogenase
MKVISKNPATEEVNSEFDTFDRAKIEGVCRESRAAFKEWRELDINDRAEYIMKLALALRAKKDEYARYMTIEMGKPIRQSLAEVEKCAWTAEVYANNAEKWLADEIVDAGAKESFITPEPLGVILSIMPWNFPFWQALRFGIPALTAGNVSILRHSNSVPICAMAIESAFASAGFPANVFRTIITDHGEVKRLIRSRSINGVSLTGSLEAGRSVGSVAGKSVKKFVLELGGSDAFIVLDDADVGAAAQVAVEARIVNSGQSCIAAKRFIVMKGVAEAFTSGLVEAMRSKKVGDPMDMGTDIGPLANKQQLDNLDAQVKSSVALGAKAECGGVKREGKGYFYEPTVLAGVKPNMPVAKEEVFGPVAPVIIAKSENDALRIANNSRFGLGASVWTEDTERGERMARALDVGMAFVNGMVVSDPRFPFGGVKESGIGRELSRYGMLEFTNIKSVIIK